MKILIGSRHPVIVAALVLVPYGVTYFAVVGLLRVPEANAVINRALRMIRCPETIMKVRSIIGTFTIRDVVAIEFQIKTSARQAQLSSSA